MRLDLGNDIGELRPEVGFLLQCGYELFEGELFLPLRHFCYIIEG